MKIYRLVDKLNLDWIFICINRSKIDNMVGGSVTHTQTTFKRDKLRNAIGREKGRS